MRPRNTRVSAKWPVLPVLGLAFVSAPLPAQRYEFRNYGQEDGLTNLVVASIAQDHQGFLWVGTQNGLFRYDGERFQGFFQSHGLPDSNVLSVHESGDGTLWVGTSTGLARWVGDRFEAVQVGRPFQITGRHSISSRSDGVVYAGTSEGLLVGRRRPDGSGYSWQFDSLPVVTGAIRSTYWDPRAGELWLGASGGLFEFHDGRIERRGADAGVPPDPWGGLLADREGNVWIRSPGRLLVRRRGQQRFEAADRDLPKGGMGEMTVTPTGQLLVGTSVGLAVRSGDRWDVIDTQRGLPADPVSALFVDREGSPWIGLSGSGLARWLGYPRWEGWNRGTGLGNSAIGGVVRDAFGTLWVGTDQGLNYRPAGTQSWHMWPPKQGLAKANISELTLDRFGKIWVVADDVVYRVDPGEKRAIRFGKESGLATEKTVSVAVDLEGAVWVACVDGLYCGRVRGKKLELQRLLPNGSADSERFGKVLVDRRGRIWVAGTRGLHLFANGGWSRFTTRNGLSSDLVRYVAEAQDGTLWIGYGAAAGVSHAVVMDERIRVTNNTQNTGLRSNRAYSLGLDHRGWLWVGTDSGMDRYNGRDWRHYDRADGLLWDDCNNAFLADEDGSVWLATSRGLSHFRPPESEPVLQPSPVVITAARSGEHSFAFPSSIELPFRDRALQVSFAALTFVNEERMVFRYRLAASGSPWMETRTRQMQIAALSAGRHSLEVIAAADGASWSASPARLEITILPPWWGSLWFRSAFIGGLILLGWQFWRLRVRGMVAEQSRLEFAVEVRTRELAAEKELTERLLNQSREASHLKTAFLANMSHEIRTPMNGVLGMVSIVLDTNLSAEQREFLTMAKSSAESLLHVLNDILDLSKIEAGKLELSPVEFAIGEMLAGVLRPMALKAFEKGVDLILDIDEDVPNALIGDPGRLQQIVVNLVGNAVKFTERGEISVRVVAESAVNAALTAPKRLRFEVRDTGIGIPLEKQQIVFEAFSQADASMARKYGGTGLGLTITSKLVAIMGGQIAVESEVGKGTAIVFTAEFELPPAAAQSLPQECGMAGIRVLVIEGNRTTSGFLNRLLRARGLATATVDSVAEALRVLGDKADEFDVILLDTQIGDREAIESITRGNRAGVPIVLLSYLGRFANEDWRRNPAIRGVISKPVTAADLKAAIRAAVMSRGEESGGGKDRADVPGDGDSRATSRKRILLVDDNAVNRRVGQALLEKLGHAVMVASSGAEGIQALESDRFDVVLMDIEMPELDGFDATAEIRRRGLDYPRMGEGRSRIIAMTAHAMTGFREKCIAAGMDGYVAKPVRVPELKAALEDGY